VKIREEHLAAWIVFCAVASAMLLVYEILTRG